MAEHIFIRVTAENFDQWKSVHDSCEEARKDFGMADGPFYRDDKDSNSALVHLVAEEGIDKAMGWFKDERFQQANAQVTLVGSREIYLAQRR